MPKTPFQKLTGILNEFAEFERAEFCAPVIENDPWSGHPYPNWNADRCSAEFRKRTKHELLTAIPRRDDIARRLNHAVAEFEVIAGSSWLRKDDLRERLNDVVKKFGDVRCWRDDFTNQFPDCNDPRAFLEDRIKRMFGALDALKIVNDWTMGEIQSQNAGRQTDHAEAQGDPDSPMGDRDAAVRRLLNVYTNGLADERIDNAVDVIVDKNLSANEKLSKIDKSLRIPATASGEQLGRMLGVSKTAVQKTQWYEANRKGEKAHEIGRRHELHGQRAENESGQRRGQRRQRAKQSSDRMPDDVDN